MPCHSNFYRDVKKDSHIDASRRNAAPLYLNLCRLLKQMFLGRDGTTLCSHDTHQKFLRLREALATITQTVISAAFCAEF
jgi:hypothetical protein